MALPEKKGLIGPIIEHMSERIAFNFGYPCVLNSSSSQTNRLIGRHQCNTYSI